MGGTACPVLGAIVLVGGWGPRIARGVRWGFLWPHPLRPDFLGFSFCFFRPCRCLFGWCGGVVFFLFVVVFGAALLVFSQLVC